MRTPKILLVVMSLLSAQVALAEHPLLSSKFLFHIGDFVATKDVELSVDGNVGERGTYVDLEAAWGAKEQEDVLATEARWRFGERWQVAAQFFRTSFTRPASLDRDIDFAGYQFRAGVDVSAQAGFKITRLMVGRDFVRDEEHLFGAGFGLHQIEIGAALSGEAFIDDVSIGATRAAAKANGPLPNLGAWYVWAPNDRWALTARLDWLSADVDPYDGTIINASAGANLRLLRNIGVGINYNVFSLDVGVTDSGWRGEFDLRYHGPYLMVSAYW